MRQMLVPAASLLLALGCQTTPISPAQSSSTGQTEISSLSDEFADGSRLGDWKHVDKTEGWNADQLAQISVSDGWLTLVPHTNTWYMDYRGVLVYKEVSGDFVVTTRLGATGRDGRSAPRSLYSLGGLMIRSPRSDSARTWRPGGENYVFLSLGSADQAGTFQFEVKTTERSQSNLEKIPAGGSEALLRVAKIGSQVIALRNQGAGWVVHKRYTRSDMPGTLQVGLTTYTDYPSASQMDARAHNSTVIRGGNPDLIARFDYVRYSRPKVQPGFDASRATDGEILALLGE